MTPKVTVTFVVDLTLFMTPKGHRVIRGRHDPLTFWGHNLGQTDHKGHRDLWGHKVGHGDL